MVEASKDSGKHCLRPRTKQYICEKSWMLLLFPPFHIHVIFFLIQLLMDILHSKQVTIPTHSLRPEGAENITFGSQVSDLQSGPSMMSWVDPHPFNRVDPHPFNWVDPHPFDLWVWIDWGHHWRSGLYVTTTHPHWPPKDPYQKRTNAIHSACVNKLWGGPQWKLDKEFKINSSPYETNFW